MTQVIGIGSALFDILMTADRFPAEDTKLEGRETKLQCGGPCATALVAMSKLGVSSAYMGTVGGDMYGSFIKAELEKYGVGTRYIRTEAGRQSFHSFILLNLASASRTCIWNRGTVRPPCPQDIDLAALGAASCLHLDGHQIDSAVYAAGKAREYGVPVSLDAGGLYPGIERLLPLVDILIPSEEFALGLTGCTAAEEAAAVLQQRFGPSVLIITQGSRGGFLWDAAARRPLRYPVYPVKAVDSNGAGDTFHGAFVAARIKGLAVPDAAAFASAASALKCTRFGAQQGIPGWTEVIAFQKERKGVIRHG